MWQLQSSCNSELVHYLLCGSAVNVSRFGNHHIQISDSSISKLHAHFSLSHEEASLKDTKRLPEVILSDLKSSNGTFLLRNKRCEKLIPNSPKTLRVDDEIRFGKESLWRLIYKPLVLSTSALTNPEVKNKLKKDVLRLGGHILKEWTNDCSVLVMVDLVLTVKAVCALTSGAHIVTPNYLTDMIDAISAKKNLPDPNQYLPPLKEPSINALEVSFAPDSSRSKLFSGKVFIFQTEKSCLKMQSAVLGAGGTCIVLSNNNVPKVTSQNHILVKPSEFRENSQLPEIVQQAIKLLREKKMSMIPESDIGLSIAYKSVEKYCNPAFNVNGILRPRSCLSHHSQNVVIYATETQPESEVQIFNPISRTTIKESGESSKAKQTNSSFISASVTSSVAKPSGASVSGSMQDQSNTVVFPPSESSFAKDELMEDKENCGKRKRSPTSEKHSPATKRNLLSRRRTNLSNLAATEEMLCDQDEVDRDVNFNPGHFSTQKESPLRVDANTKGEKEGEFISPIGVPSSRKNVRVVPSPSSPPKDNATLLGPCSAIPKSIPFEPYTLASLLPNDISTLDRTDDDKATQPFQDTTVVKIEDCEPVMNRSPEKIQGHDNTWLRREKGKKTSEQGLNKEEFGHVSRLQENVPPATDTKEGRTLRNDNEHEFALPASTKGKRRGRCKLDEEIQENVSKRIKIEPQAPRPATTNPETVPISNNKSHQELQNVGERQSNQDDKENMQTFLSKSTIVKHEKNPDIVNELAETFEKSLVVVQFVSLIKAVTAPLAVKISSNGLPNYKKFKKVLHGASIQDVRILPRIIGGKDLVCDTNRGCRMESFLATQPDIQEEIERRDTERRAVETDNFDSAFTLPNSSTRQRKRGRI